MHFDEIIEVLDESVSNTLTRNSFIYRISALAQNSFSFSDQQIQNINKTLKERNAAYRIQSHTAATIKIQIIN